MKTLQLLFAAVATLALASPAMANPEDIMNKAKCNKCHTATTTKKGPSFADIAAKYKGKPDPTSMLVDLLKTGGKDDHDVLKASDADLKAVVATILAK